MDKYDYHFISIKFLTAILLALIFAFLLVYVFTPQKRDSYPVYRLEKEEINKVSQINILDREEQTFMRTVSAEQLEFENALKTRSFLLMEASKDSMLAVISSNYLERLNGLREERMAVLEQRSSELKIREEQLLQEKRKDLENNLSAELQSIRQQIKEKYSDFSQKEIRDNYLKIINLRIALEVVAETQAKKEKIEKELAEIMAAQEEILAEKDSLFNNEFSAETQRLILEFNQEFASYREKIRTEHRSILAAEERKIENELAEFRKEIKTELAAAREEKSAELDQLIIDSKEKYY